MLPSMRRGSRSLLLVLRRHRVDQVLHAFGAHSLVPRAAILLLLALSEHHWRERVDDAVPAGCHDRSKIESRFLDQRPTAKRVLSSGNCCGQAFFKQICPGAAVVGLQKLSWKKINYFLPSRMFSRGAWRHGARWGSSHLRPAQFGLYLDL